MTSIESIIERQCRLWEEQQRATPQSEEEHQRATPVPVITVSRQSGSRGSYFASQLALKLNYTRMHREIIDHICQTSGYRKRIIEALDEKNRSAVATLVDAILTGQAVDHTDYDRHLCTVVLTMSQLGGLVLVGRGAGLILGPERGFHIRVVAPAEQRVQNLMTYKAMSEIEARDWVQESDVQRRNYIRKRFDVHIDDSALYDLVINTSLLDVEELVPATIAMIDAKMDKLAHLPPSEG